VSGGERHYEMIPRRVLGNDAGHVWIPIEQARRSIV
jgi:hypothetical protein